MTNEERVKDIRETAPPKGVSRGSSNRGGNHVRDIERRPGKINMPEKKAKKVIAVDQDWVLAKLTEKWVKTYNTIFNDNLKIENISTWNIRDHVKPEAKEYILNILNMHKFYRDLDVVVDSQRVLRKLSEEYEIIIVTDPFTRMSFKSKYDWLEEHFDFIPTRNYVFTGNKSMIRADYLIDDGVHNFEGFTGVPILFDAPYNRDTDEYYRVNNWQDIEHLFDSKEKLNELHSYGKRQNETYRR